MKTTVVRVIGMSCGSCASSVSAALGDLQGVHRVRVDLTTGEVTVTSEGIVTDNALRTAIESAGYTVDPA
ncbi:heavy-metal-associated domain-containing protein [Microbispora sp. ATCC PTA-5024]|uniref:heavy-metal-associated domain-containing protein n=1 Tax=Microbispora sp. ATCC PTA-5024 TaxID=316330 RepID=UPI0005690B20|nr:heavy metal-associated domain-containing protein [Microbispora sp. ATCC PTA-5024]